MAFSSRAKDRLLDELRKLRNRVESGRLKDPAKIQQAIGCKLQKNPRVARYYQVSLAGSDENRTVKLYRIRRAGTAEAEQQRIYETLGVDHRNLPGTKMSVPMKTPSAL